MTFFETGIDVESYDLSFSAEKVELRSKQMRNYNDECYKRLRGASCWLIEDRDGSCNMNESKS